MKEESIKEEALSGANEKLETGADGIKYLNGRVWILKVNNLREVVMDEAHRYIFNSPRSSQDVHGCKRVLLVAKNEERHCHIYRHGRFRSCFWRLLQKALETVDKITAIKERLKTTRSQQKSYADNSRKPLEFQVGDQVLLKVSPWKDTIHFRKQWKLNPRYTRPFKVLSKVGLVAYHLELPRELSGIHNVFHVSNLKKCLTDETLVVSLKELKITDKL
uniref:Putative reverse transcriptase domain-containing protein n=1 Tax=Tanacetum cinerariifolium TaxID=118510 RepID=A0A6L2MYQ8_TANCI|nr:putative reverse transcriptase domain-containing protein [Tanacetum cinerariifolium]